LTHSLAFGFGSVVELKHGQGWKAPLEIFWSSRLLRAGSTRAGCSGPFPLGFEYLHSAAPLGNLFLCLATFAVNKLYI